MDSFFKTFVKNTPCASSPKRPIKIVFEVDGLVLELRSDFDRINFDTATAVFAPLPPGCKLPLSTLALIVSPASGRRSYFQTSECKQ